MKVKATLYIQKTIWMEHEVEVDIADAQSNDDTNRFINAFEIAFNDWASKQEDSDNPAVSYELDDWGWEALDKTSEIG
jgi:hypothetical protein